MIVQGLVERRTRDLDFFAQVPEAVGRVVGSVEAALEAVGIATNRAIDTDQFVRIEVSRGQEICDLDFGSDARIRPDEVTPFGPALAPEELAADKTLALFGRAAGRDFVDVYFLAQRFGEVKLCQLAEEKDAGFERTRLAEALRSFGRLDREMYEVDDETYARIESWAQAWAHDLGQEPTRDRALGVAPRRSRSEGRDLPGS